MALSRWVLKTPKHTTQKKKKKQLLSLCLMRLVLQPLSHLSGPLLFFAHFVFISLLLWGPKLSKILQVWLSEEQQSSFSISWLCCCYKHMLSLHHYNSTLPPYFTMWSTRTSRSFSAKCLSVLLSLHVLVHGLIPSQVQNCVSVFVEFMRFLLAHSSGMLQTLWAMILLSSISHLPMFNVIWNLKRQCILSLFRLLMKILNSIGPSIPPWEMPLVRLVIFQLMVQSVFYPIYSPLIQSTSCQFVFNPRTDCVANLAKSKVDVIKCLLLIYRACHLLKKALGQNPLLGILFWLFPIVFLSLLCLEMLPWELAL